MIDVDVSGTYLILWPSEAEWEIPAVMKSNQMFLQLHNAILSITISVPEAVKSELAPGASTVTCN